MIRAAQIVRTVIPWSLQRREASVAVGNRAALEDPGDERDVDAGHAGMRGDSLHDLSQLDEAARRALDKDSARDVRGPARRREVGDMPSSAEASPRTARSASTGYPIEAGLRTTPSSARSPRSPSARPSTR